ncbi:peptide deformylase [Clostridium cellulovorans]|uniref:Peptide deformylase n=1 Tax=Clostridium cellulovorans (strain ATCC 35296 / DSM 3052 / OCM 3 / 743B) TaxID=573061 RepID=D9SLA1_CLOC7|nr:peptide deformylase [Clostridium cellulovorans]ADL51617.1 peptide deformylase [Clostridium cellulovorans 743B]
MAIRNIRTVGDAVLRKNSKNVEVIDDRTKVLIQDMIDTMYDADGVGLAAPQVGILKKIFVIDIGEGPIVFINPEILETEGSYVDSEGCLSIPGESAEVERPYKVKVKALNENGEEFILEGEELLARAICHENDHLYGTLYIDRALESGE